MKHIITYFLIFILCVPAYSQDLKGVWKGSFYPKGTTSEKGKLIYLEITGTQGKSEGKTRNEEYNSPAFALKKCEVNQKNTIELSIKETIITKKDSKAAINWCKMNLELKFNPETGYITGTYSSSDCRNYSGEIILYREAIPFPSEVENPESQQWFINLNKDLKKGLNAPEIRAKERANFRFQPIYFDYDKSELKPEFFEFLNRLIHVIEGHSDLRVKVTGHTDSDGSDNYNDGLSQRRAQAIINYFISKGLSADRLEFDFKGEHKPTESNSTPEGRQKNRRVEFSFI